MLQHVVRGWADPWLNQRAAAAAAAAASISIPAMKNNPRSMNVAQDEQGEVGSFALGECIIGSTSTASAIEGSASSAPSGGSSISKQQQPHQDEDEGDKLPSWSSNSSSMEEEDAEMIAAQSLLALDVGRIRRTGAVFVHGGVPIVQKRVQRRARSSLALHRQQQQNLDAHNGPLTRRASKRRQRNASPPATAAAAMGSSSSAVAAAAARSSSAHKQSGGPVRSKRGRAQLLPSKFHDSVLVQWKKKRSR